MTPEERTRIAKEENARYLREWRRKNPDKMREINRRYREKKRQEAAGNEQTEKN